MISAKPILGLSIGGCQHGGAADRVRSGMRGWIGIRPLSLQESIRSDTCLCSLRYFRFQLYAGCFGVGCSRLGHVYSCCSGWTARSCRRFRWRNISIAVHYIWIVAVAACNCSSGGQSFCHSCSILIDGAVIQIRGFCSRNRRSLWYWQLLVSSIRIIARLMWMVVRCWSLLLLLLYMVVFLFFNDNLVVYFGPRCGVHRDGGQFIDFLLESFFGRRQRTQYLIGLVQTLSAIRFGAQKHLRHRIILLWFGRKQSLGRVIVSWEISVADAVGPVYRTVVVWYPCIFLYVHVNGIDKVGFVSSIRISWIGSKYVGSRSSNR